MQTNSPEVDESDGAYVTGARPGMFLDTGTGEVMTELRMIPCHYKRAMVVWKPDRGGFVGQHEVGYEANLPRKQRDGKDTGIFIDRDGNEVVDTRYFFCERLTADNDALPVILPFTSTQIKKAKTWLTRMQAMKATGPNGRFTPPMYSHVWKITSVQEENALGKYKGYKVDLDSQITDPALFQVAKDAREMFKAADTKVKPPGEGEPMTDAGGGSAKDDEIPF